MVSATEESVEAVGAKNLAAKTVFPLATLVPPEEAVVLSLKVSPDSAAAANANMEKYRMGFTVVVPFEKTPS